MSWAQPQSVRMSWWSAGIVALALTGTLVGQSPAVAQEAEAAFYRHKTVKMIVGYGPGGGYDVYARMLAPHLAKVLDATVVVENQPGAGGLSALNRIYAAQPDGLQIMIVNGTAAGSAQLIDQEAVRYDLAKVGHLGLISASPWIWHVRPDAPYRTLADVMKPGVKVRWAATGLIDSMSDGAAIMCEALKIDCQVVIGYKGSNEAVLAVVRGEMDAIYSSDTSANSYVKSGQTRPIVTLSREKSRFFPDLPTIFESVKLTPEQEWWFNLRATLDALGRILVTSPNLPPERLAFLQASVKKMLTDPALIAEGEKTQRYIDFMDAEKTRQMAVATVSALTPDQKERVKKVMTRAD